MKRITMKDVAKAAGVSISVISCVVNERPNGYGNIVISTALRERIKTLAEAMNYRPHRMARALRTGENKSIGIIAAHTYYRLHAFRTFLICENIVARGYDYNIQLIDSQKSAQLEQAIEVVQDYGVQGVIMIGMDDMDRSHFKGIRDRANGGLSVVEVSSVSHGKFPSISPDYHKAAFQMAQQVLAQRGGKSDVFVVSPTIDSPGPSVSKRIQGIKEACEKSGSAVFHTFDAVITQSPGDTRRGYLSTVKLLESHKPDIIFYSNDLYAIGGLKAIIDAGLSVPHDIMICGFDGEEVTEFTQPGITTVIQPIQEIAEKTTEVLFDMIEGKLEMSKTAYLIPCEIAFRQSTG